MQEYPLGLTVLIATFNRAPILKETLEALVAVDRTGIECEIVVIDNRCSDNTAEIVASYKDRLPISLISETKAGKNCALNAALRTCALREIVVFTDDDISPDRNWFQTIAASVNQWPQVAVFGGTVEILWPEGRQPEWAEAEWIRVFGYAWHRYAEKETFYPSPACPFGPNYWVRRSVFKKVPFFDESIGPRPNDRIMGSETSFLMELHRAGFQMLYYPPAVVHHRILEKECRIPALRRRGFTFGRGQVRIHGWHRKKLYSRNRVLWAATMVADYAYTAVRYLTGIVRSDARINCELTVASMVRFGKLHETRRLAWQGFRKAGRKVERSNSLAERAS